MISRTSLAPRYLRRVKRGVLAAVKLAHWSNGPGVVIVPDRKGVPSVRVVWHAGKGVEIFDRQDRDITARVLAALRQLHAPLTLEI